jgi:aminopeptidase N
MMNDNQLSAISSPSFQQKLSNYSGIDLSNFFDDWVFQPGFPVFSIDSIRTILSGSNYLTTLHTKQKLHGATQLYSEVPLLITFYSANFEKAERTIYHTAQADHSEISLPFEPIFATINNDYSIAQAAISEEHIIKQNGDVNFGRALLNVNVSNIQDSILLHITHHWAAADELQFTNSRLKLSKSRFYSVKGLNLNKAKIKGLIFYDGRNQGTNGNGFLDLDLNITQEDSLYLLYRPSAAFEWIKYPFYTRNVLSNPNNKHGRFEIDSLLAGDYTIAYGDIQQLGIKKEINLNAIDFTVFPNPAKNNITVATKENTIGRIEIYDISGRIVLQQAIKGKYTQINKKLKLGNYVVFINENGKSSLGKKISIIE